MADKTYGLYPFAWNAPSGNQPGYHSAPDGSLCVLDFRPIPQQSIQGQSGSYGFFAWEGSPPNDLIVLGVGDCRTIVSTPTMRTEIKTKLGLAQLPSGSTLIDLIYDCLGPLAVPDGATGVRPLMPTTAEELEIHLSGHSIVKSLKFNPATLLAANPTGHANKIRDVIRLDLDKVQREHGDKVAQKYLGATLLGLGYHRDELANGAPGRRNEWQRLMPAAWGQAKKDALSPRGPSTSAAETWPNATSDLSSLAQDQTWTELATDGFADGLKVASNTCRATSAFTNRLGICGTAVSSANHYAEGAITIGDAANGTAFITARQHATRGSFYAHGFWRASSSRRLYKCVTGTFTQLVAAAVATPSGVVVRCDVNGSTVTGVWPSLGDQSVTDTSVTGNLQGGVYMYLDAPVETYAQVGAWSIDDGLSPPPVAAFSGTPLSGTAPLSVAFTDLSTNTPTSWLWEKSSDGGSNWSNFASGPTTQNPTESFTAGTWAVRLTATNGGGSDTEEKLAYVTVTAAGGKAMAGSYSLGIWRGVGL